MLIRRHLDPTASAHVRIVQSEITVDATMERPVRECVFARTRTRIPRIVGDAEPGFAGFRAATVHWTVSHAPTPGPWDTLHSQTTASAFVSISKMNPIIATRKLCAKNAPMGSLDRRSHTMLVLLVRRVARLRPFAHGTKVSRAQFVQSSRRSRKRTRRGMPISESGSTFSVRRTRLRFT